MEQGNWPENKSPSIGLPAVGMVEPDLEGREVEGWRGHCLTLKFCSLRAIPSLPQHRCPLPGGTWPWSSRKQGGERREGGRGAILEKDELPGGGGRRRKIWNNRQLTSPPAPMSPSGTGTAGLVWSSQAASDRTVGSHSWRWTEGHEVHPCPLAQEKTKP